MVFTCFERITGELYGYERIRLVFLIVYIWMYAMSPVAVTTIEQLNMFNRITLSYMKMYNNELDEW